MKKSGRYKTSGLAEDSYEPGSQGRQAGLPPFDFGGIKGRVKQEYFAAVQAGMDYNYAPMESIFKTVLARTLRQE